MSVTRLLIANRGEVAVRVIRTAMEMGISTVAIYSEDDGASLHVGLATESVALTGMGAAPYLDIAQVIDVAKAHDCDALHPGWGFLSENAALAEACAAVGITFVGPDPETLRMLGEKTEARALAARHGVPTLAGSGGPVTLEEAKAFLASLGDGGSMLIKAIAGGGGRGMRVVEKLEETDSAFARCQSEALRAFGNGDVYVEERMPRAKHIEVQIVGDGSGAVSHLWERDCSIQRRHQKVVEIAPSPTLHPELRDRLTNAAVQIASGLKYRGVGTFEFLVEADAANTPGGRFAFIEANARLQVEHTVTEEIFGVDLVRAQLRIAGGATLAEVRLNQAAVPAPRGSAIQFRINTEILDQRGQVRPSLGTLSTYQLPAGPGIRVDTFGYAGYKMTGSFDSLLAKVIVHSPGDFDETVARSARALREFSIVGVGTNLPFLKNLLDHPQFRSGSVHTTFVDEEIVTLAAPRDDDVPVVSTPAASVAAAAPQLSGHTAGARVDAVDPLAVLSYGKRAPTPRTQRTAGADEPGAVLAPMQATIVSFEVVVGDVVRKGQEVAVLNAMKMEHVLHAPVSGTVRGFNASPGDTVVADQLLVRIEPSAAEDGHADEADAADLDLIRPDLAEVLTRHEQALDGFRPDMVARRHETEHRTARENIDDLLDEGSFVEWGSLVLSHDSRFTHEELIKKGAADGMIIGIGSINGADFDEPESQVVIISYDYMVFAGTQGGRNHAKTDKAVDVATQGRIPVVLFAEGGGGRAGGGDRGSAPRAGGPGTVPTFRNFARMSGLVPMVGITSGRCFAGNASLLGLCDVIIATEDANIGMGGPAMVEGGGLGVFAPEDIGPMDVQTANGVVDILVRDEAEAVKVAKQYLSYFQGRKRTWECADQRLLRHAIPENRLRVYSVQQLIRTIGDTDSYLELRKDFGTTMVTAFIRVEGRPVGIIANNPSDTGGAITSDGADKASRFMQLCDAFDIPLLFLCDTPGIMVGPEAEKTAIVRHANRMFIVGANINVPAMTIILRKGYGLGALAMAAGNYRAPFFTVAWPTSEFGGMGLEGQVKLGFRNELAAIEDPEKRRELYESLVAKAYERGKGLNEATNFGVDETIDPADSRRWVSAVLKSYRPEPRLAGKKRAFVDGW